MVATRAYFHASLRYWSRAPREFGKWCRRIYDERPEQIFAGAQCIGFSFFAMYWYYQDRMKEERYRNDLYRNRYVVMRPTPENIKTLRPPEDYPGPYVSHRENTRWNVLSYIFDPKDEGD